MEATNQDVFQPERWVSVSEIADHLGISKETVYRWTESKKIPAHKIGKKWKFKISEVDRWVRVGGAEGVVDEKK